MTVAVYYRGQPPLEFRHVRVGDETDYLLMENFAAAIDCDRVTVFDTRAAREIAATIDAALTSARCGVAVDVHHVPSRTPITKESS